jgi:hypothetical protein
MDVVLKTPWLAQESSCRCGLCELFLYIINKTGVSAYYGNPGLYNTPVKPILATA